MMQKIMTFVPDNVLYYINLDADIDFDKKITLRFYSEYYERKCDDFTLPKCDTHILCENLIRDNALNIIFIPAEMLNLLFYCMYVYYLLI